MQPRWTLAAVTCPVVGIAKPGHTTIIEMVNRTDKSRLDIRFTSHQTPRYPLSCKPFTLKLVRTIPWFPACVIRIHTTPKGEATCPSSIWTTFWQLLVTHPIMAGYLPKQSISHKYKNICWMPFLSNWEISVQWVSIPLTGSWSFMRVMASPPPGYATLLHRSGKKWTMLASRLRISGFPSNHSYIPWNPEMFAKSHVHSVRLQSNIWTGYPTRCRQDLHFSLLSQLCWRTAAANSNKQLLPSFSPYYW